jgi:hypothetical protein
MQPRKIVTTTLGDLIVSVTDQVTPYVSDPKVAYLLVAYIVTDLLAPERVRFHPRRPHRLRALANGRR